MMLRWVGLLSTGLLLVALSCGHYYWSEQKNRIQRDATRDARVKWQRAEKTVHLLQNVDARERLYRLDQSLESLQIAVAKVLNEVDTGRPVSIESFQQNTLADSFESPRNQVISQLRVSFTMSAVHVIELLEGLVYIETSIAPWPLDVRLCNIWRTADPSLKASCVMDIYHWDSFI